MLQILLCTEGQGFQTEALTCRYRSKEREDSYSEGIAHALNHYPAEHVLCASDLFFDDFSEQLNDRIDEVRKLKDTHSMRTSASDCLTAYTKDAAGNTFHSESYGRVPDRCPCKSMLQDTHTHEEKEC